MLPDLRRTDPFFSLLHQKERATQAQVALVFLNSRPPLVRLFELVYLYHRTSWWVWGKHPILFPVAQSGKLPVIYRSWIFEHHVADRSSDTPTCHPGASELHRSIS